MQEGELETPCSLKATTSQKPQTPEKLEIRSTGPDSSEVLSHRSADANLESSVQVDAGILSSHLALARAVRLRKCELTDRGKGSKSERKPSFRKAEAWNFHGRS